MTPLIFKRILAWLCIALVLLTGVAPAQGVVLCIEADGCVRVEAMTSAADCENCDGHEPSSQPRRTQPTTAPDAGCPCIDLEVPGSPQGRRVPPRPIEFEAGPWLMPRLALFSLPLDSVAVSLCTTLTEAPRPPESLAHIRSVVLLV